MTHRGGARRRLSRARGFTLVELMVALTGGLFISIFVFMIARQGSQFYQREARMSNATIGVMNGFQRLRADIARAGFLASPNIQRDPSVCSDRSPNDGFTDANRMLQSMGSVRIEVGGSADQASGNDAGTFWSNNGLTPDRLFLAGSYSSADQFPAGEIARLNPASDVWTIHLQPNSPAMTRLGYRTDGSQTSTEQRELIESLFTPDDSPRVLRIVDKKGASHFGVIESVGLLDGEQAPYIELSTAIKLKEKTSGTSCGLQGLNVGATVNLVNFIRYELRSLSGDANYAPIYADQEAGTYEETRTELVREELDVAGNVIAGTTELVAEYAVDLKFGLTVYSPNGNGSLVTYPEDDDAIDSLANPQWIRSVHARLAVRSREADREANLDANAAGIPDGLYRVGLGPDNEDPAPYARVRTLQADIALRNQARARWQ